jgi:hypothetical protein
VAYCALTIGCGTRYEGRYPAGIAHFVEHTLFRGTSRKSAAVITGYLDRLGGELNAYTTKEEIVLHATVLKEDLGKAARLLFELATEATFPDKEIQTERGVVLDEINLLPMDARMFLQNILDNKSKVSVMGTEIPIRDGFFVFGTMNVETGAGTQPLPLPLVDRAAVVKEFKATLAQSAVGAGLC